MKENAEALVDSIFDNADPLIARDYVSLVLASEDPEVKRKYFELRARRKEKSAAGGGALINFTINMPDGVRSFATIQDDGKAVIDVEATEVEQVDQRQEPAQLAPPTEPEVDLDAVLNLGALIAD